MATLAELQTRLANLETAYDRIVNRGAESYTTADGRTFSALKLRDLEDAIASVERRIAATTPGGARNYSGRGRVW